MKIFLSEKVPAARLEALAAKRAAKGKSTPMLDERPELFEDLQFAWDGWEELSLSRTWHTDGSAQGILHSEVREWLDLNLVTDDDTRHELYVTIKTIDVLWLDIRRKKSKKKRGHLSSSNRGKKRKRR